MFKFVFDFVGTLVVAAVIAGGYHGASHLLGRTEPYGFVDLMAVSIASGAGDSIRRGTAKAEAQMKVERDAEIE